MSTRSDAILNGPIGPTLRQMTVLPVIGIMAMILSKPLTHGSSVWAHWNWLRWLYFPVTFTVNLRVVCPLPPYSVGQGHWPHGDHEQAQRITPTACFYRCLPSH